MTTTTKEKPDLHRSINHAGYDHMTEEGVRISTPLYIDLTTAQRKEILSAIRQRLVESGQNRTPDTESGIKVTTMGTSQSEIETYLGMAIDVLRGVLFQRGGIEYTLVLRLQSVAGIEYVSAKDIQTAFKKRTDLIKEYAQHNLFPV